MTKKNKIIIITTISAIMLALLFVILYNQIPRVTYRYDKANDGYIVDRCYGNKSEYILPSSYKGKPIIAIGREAFRDTPSLRRIDLSQTDIKEIGLASFSHCANLEEVIFNESLENIENNAFFDCDSLTIINLENTSLVSLQGSVFYDCNNLAEVYLPASLEYIGSYCFYGTNLNRLSIYSTTTIRNYGLDGVSDDAIIWR